MTVEEAVAIVERTRSFVGTIEGSASRVGRPFMPEELEAILFLMRNRPLRPGSI